MERLCDTLRGPVYRLALSVIRNHHSAEDCTQDSLFKVSQVVQRLDVSRSIVGFVTTIALHEALRIRRRRLQPMSEVSDELPSCDPMPFEVVAEAEVLALLRSAVDDLPPKYRDVLRIRMTEASMQDIADALGIGKLGTVRSLLSRAYDYLRRNPSLAAAAA